MNGERGFRWPCAFDRETAENDLHALSKRVMDDMQRKYGEVNDSQESELAERRG